MQTFQTDRLVLRPFTPDDQQFVHEVHTHPGIARFIPGQVSRSSEATRAQTERFMSLADHPVHGFWCVTLADGTPVALVMFKPVPFSQDSPRAQEEQDVEIGWRQHPDHGGHGYVTEAAARVLEHAWASGLQRVVAVRTRRTTPRWGCAGGWGWSTRARATTTTTRPRGCSSQRRKGAHDGA